LIYNKIAIDSELDKLISKQKFQTLFSEFQYNELKKEVISSVKK